MEIEKLEQLKTTLATFEQMFTLIKELIETVEQYESGDTKLAAAVDALNNAKDSLENITSNLDEAESSVCNAKSDADDLLREIRSSLRDIE